jgi:hypothetical protein
MGPDQPICDKLNEMFEVILIYMWLLTDFAELERIKLYKKKNLKSKSVEKGKEIESI